jgi:hypothetical protein
MDIKELEKQLNKAEEENNYSEVVRLIEEIRSLMKEEIDKTTLDNDRKLLDKGYKLYTIKLYENKIKLETEKNKIFYLRGKLIQSLKDYKKVATKGEQNILRYKLENELKLHKELSKDIRVTNKDKIKISERLGLKIKEISSTISIFLSKHDVINKLKNTLKSTAFGGVFTLAIEAVLTLVSGGVLSPALLVSSLPIMGYIGISSLIRNIITKTPYQKYSYKNSEEYQNLFKNVENDYKEEYEEIRRLISEKENAKNLDIVKINKRIIELYDKVRNDTKVEELKEAFKLEKYNLLKENKSIYEEVIDKHLKDKVRLSKEEYQAIVKDNMKNDIAIFESENAIKEAGKEAVKKSGIDVVTLFIARLVASAAIPGFAVKSVADLLIPLGFMLSNNLIGIIKYKNKIRPTKYNNKKVKLNNKEKFESLAKSEKLATATL